MGCIQSRPQPSSDDAATAPRPSSTAIDGRPPPTAQIPASARWKAVEAGQKEWGASPPAAQSSELTVVGSEAEMDITKKEEDVEDEDRIRRQKKMAEARRKFEEEEQERRNDFQFM